MVAGVLLWPQIQSTNVAISWQLLVSLHRGKIMVSSNGRWFGQCSIREARRHFTFKLSQQEESVAVKNTIDQLQLDLGELDQQVLTNSDKIIEADAINKHENESTDGEDEVSKKYVPKQDFADLAKVRKFSFWVYINAKLRCISRLAHSENQVWLIEHTRLEDTTVKWLRIFCSWTDHWRKWVA